MRSGGGGAQNLEAPRVFIGPVARGQVEKYSSEGAIKRFWI